MVLLSIVTPVYNQARFLPDTLRSVAGLPVPHEHVVVDGGSSDGTVEILQATCDSNLQWISEPDRGQTDAVNKGLARVNGDLIGWLNADDLYVPEAVGRAVTYLADNPEVDAIYGFMEIINACGEHIDFYRPRPFDWRRYLFFGSYVPTPTVLFRRHRLDAVGLLSDRYHDAADFDFYLRLFHKATVRRVPDVLVKFRRHADSKTVRDVGIQRREAMAIRECWARNRRDRLLMRLASRLS